MKISISKQNVTVRKNITINMTKIGLVKCEQATCQDSYIYVITGHSTISLGWNVDVFLGGDKNLLIFVDINIPNSRCCWQKMDIFLLIGLGQTRDIQDIGGGGGSHNRIGTTMQTNDPDSEGRPNRQQVNGNMENAPFMVHIIIDHHVNGFMFPCRKIYIFFLHIYPLHCQRVSCTPTCTPTCEPTCIVNFKIYIPASGQTVHCVKVCMAKLIYRNAFVDNVQIFSNIWIYWSRIFIRTRSINF